MSALRARSSCHVVDPTGERGSCERLALPRIAFFATRHIEALEELTFDYGVRYWLWRDAPSADSDSRNFSEPKYRDLRPVEKTLLHPPPVGTVLPLTPLTAEELQAALALPEIDGPSPL